MLPGKLLGARRPGPIDAIGVVVGLEVVYHEHINPATAESLQAVLILPSDRRPGIIMLGPEQQPTEPAMGTRLLVRVRPGAL